MTRRLLPIALALVAACSSATEPDTMLVARIPAATFELDAVRASGVPFRIDNEGDRAVPVRVCGEQIVPAIERLQGTRWEQYAGGHCIATLLIASHPIEPGTGRDDAALIGEAGRYRLRFTTGDGNLFSPAFDVR